MLIMNEVIRDGRVMRAAKTLASRAEVVIVGLDRGRISVSESTSSKLVGVQVRYAKFGPLSYWGKHLVGYIARYLKAQTQMVRMGIEIDPDVIHAHDVYTLRIARKIQSKTGAKVVYDCHELYREMSMGLTGFSVFLQNQMEAWGLKNADLIIACNSYRAKIMVEEYGARREPVIVKNAVPFCELEDNGFLRKRFSELGSKVNRIIVYQGGVSPARCIEPMINAVEVVGDPSLGLAIIGPSSDEYRKSLKSCIRKKGLEKQILLIPPVDQKDLHSIACSADVGLVLYRNDTRNNYFCAPNKLQEYAMAGLAIIGSDNPPISQFLNQYQVGLTVEPESAYEIADAIKSIFGDEDALAMMKKNAAKAAKLESWDRLSHTLLDAYEQNGLFEAGQSA
jgi:glycosyltransferase involved in cell wall biosynthesis